MSGNDHARAEAAHSRHMATKFQLQGKAIRCLMLASMPCWTDEWQEGYDLLCAIYSEKAVCMKMQELVDRGYLECGVSARTGWLTDKGKEALEESLPAIRAALTDEKSSS